MTFDPEQVRTRLAGMTRPSAAALRDDIVAIARPRLSGSEGAREVEQELRRRFEASGYQVEELDFSFSTWPGRFGLPASAAVLVVTGGLGAWLLATGNPTAALVALIPGMALALAPLVLLRRAIADLPWGRVETANLLFRRPGSKPRWVVMAHRDSKSQLVPTLVRTAAIIGVAAAWVTLVLLGILWLFGEPFTLPTLAVVAGVVLVVAGVLLVFSWAGDDSPGALDNATGLAALLSAAGAASERGDVAFLLTDGEELGLAGAREVVEQLPPIEGIINVDGLDDHGRFYVAEGAGWRRRGSAPQLAAALLAAGNALDLPVERRRLPRSVLVDHLPLSAAGIPALTLLRGGWDSLLRVHRTSDDPYSLRGDGAAAGAALLIGALRLLGDAGNPHLASPRRTGS